MQTLWVMLLCANQNKVPVINSIIIITIIANLLLTCPASAPCCQMVSFAWLCMACITLLTML